MLELVFLEVAGIIQVLRIDCRKLFEGQSSFIGNFEMWRNDCSSEHIVVSYMIITNVTGMQSDRWRNILPSTSGVVIVVLFRRTIFSFNVPFFHILPIPNILPFC